MAKDATTRWTVFLDESGNFAKIGKPVIVAGLCVEERLDAHFRARFRRLTEQAAPLVPWPHHRWMVKRTTMYVVWRELPPHNSVVLPAAVEAALVTAREFLESTLAEDLESVRLAVAEGRSPNYSQVKHLDDALKREQAGAFQTLQAYAHETTGNCAEVFAELADELLHESDAFLVVAGESSVGDAAAPDGDRYLNILECVLERIGMELGRAERPGRHTVDVNVASRNINDPVLGRTRLSRERLSSICSAATPANKEVFLIAASVSAFDKDADAGIVMADMISNYLWGTMLRHPTLPTLRERSSKYFGLLPDAGTPALPQASATGVARDAIAIGREFDSQQGLGHADPWVCEQAAAWITHARGSR